MLPDIELQLAAAGARAAGALIVGGRGVGASEVVWGTSVATRSRQTSLGRNNNTCTWGAQI